MAKYAAPTPLSPVHELVGDIDMSQLGSTTHRRNGSRLSIPADNHRHYRTSSTIWRGDMEGSPLHNTNAVGMLRFDPSISDEKRGCFNVFEQRVNRSLFAGIPENYPLRMKVNLVLTASLVGFYWEVLQTVLSLVACLLYIIDTYEAALTAMGMWPDLILCVMFTLDFFLQWYAASHRGWFLLTANALVDIVTIVPVYIDIGLRGIMPNTVSSDDDSEGAQELSVLLFLRFVRILRIARIVRVFALVRTSMSAVNRQLLQLMLYVLALLFVSAGVFYLLEQDLWVTMHGAQRDGYVVDVTGEVLTDITFGDCLYFVIITATTVGFGDITPATWGGKMWTCIIVVAAFLIIPWQLQGVRRLLAMQSPYRRKYKVRHAKHVLITGNVLDVNVLRAFFSEFLHPDRMDYIGLQSSKQRVLLVGPHEPTEEIANLLVTPALDGRVEYIKASVMNEDDLFRIAADHAEACFVLCSKHAKEVKDEDKRSIVRCLVLENFNPEMRTFVQLNRADNVDLLVQADVDVVVCIDDLRMRLLALGTVFPGAVTLVDNLFRSFSQPTHDLRDYSAPWKNEYRHGCGYEIYCLETPRPLRGLTFLCAVTNVYDASEGEVIVVGVMVAHDNSSRESDTGTSAHNVNGSFRGKHSSRSSLPGSKLNSVPIGDLSEEGNGGLFEVVLSPGNDFVLPEGKSYLVVMADNIIEARHMHDANYFKAANLHEGKSYAYCAEVLENRVSSGVAATPRSTMSAFPPVTGAHVMAASAEASSPDAEDGDGLFFDACDPDSVSVQLGKEQPSARETPRAVASRGRQVVIDVAEELSGHVVIFASSLEGLGLYIECLRCGHLALSRLRLPILLLCPKEAYLDADIAVDDFENVYVMFTSERRAADLMRAGINRASRLLIVDDRMRSDDIDGESVDSNVMFSYLALEQCRFRYGLASDFHELVEVTSTSNMKVLNTKRLKIESLTKLDFINNLELQLCNDNFLNASSFDSPAAPQRPGLRGKILRIASSLGNSGRNVTAGDGSRRSFRRDRSSASDTSDSSIEMVNRRRQLSDNAVNGTESQHVSAGGLSSFVGLSSSRSVPSPSKDRGQMADFEAKRKRWAFDPMVSFKAKRRQRQLSANEEKQRFKQGAMSFRQMEGYHILPFFAAGMGFSRCMFDTLTCQAVIFKQLIAVDGVAQYGSSRTYDPFGEDEVPEQERTLPKPGYLCSIPVGTRLTGQIFHRVFLQMLTDYSAIAIALYRQCTDENKSMLPYVFTGPPPNTIVLDGDRVFLLVPHSLAGRMFGSASFECHGRV